MPEILSVTVADQFDSDAVVIPFTGLSKECGHECPLGQFAQATYNGSTQNSGPGIRLSLASSSFAVFGLFAIYFPGDGVVSMMLYNGEPSTELGTTIASFIVTLIAGDVLVIEADEVDPTIYRIKINGTTVITQTISTDLLPIDGPCVGFLLTLGGIVPGFRLVETGAFRLTEAGGKRKLEIGNLL
jgi:hypothetical protein